MKMKKALVLLVSGIAIGLFSSYPAQARIKLVALPDRGCTSIRLDHPHATLIQEERVLTLQKGVNRIDFSWKGVHLDEDSIRLTVLSHPHEAILLNVSYPPGESALIWEIHSEEAHEVRVKISYLLSFMDRLIAYKAVSDRSEACLYLKGFLILRNFSGENFQDVSVVPTEGQAFRQTIQHGETRQILFLEHPRLPLEKRWIFDAAKLPWDPEDVETNVGIPVSYVIRNESLSGLGRAPLLGGKVRVFQEDAHGGVVFFGEDNIDGVAVGEKIQIHIGDSRDIVVRQRKMFEKRINVRRNHRNQVVLYDTDEMIEAHVKNFKNEPAVLTLIQHIPGQWDMASCNMPYKRQDAFTLAFELALPSKGKQVLTMHYHRRNVR